MTIKILKQNGFYKLEVSYNNGLSVPIKNAKYKTLAGAKKGAVKYSKLHNIPVYEGGE